MEICTYPGCKEPAQARKLCFTHWYEAVQAEKQLRKDEGLGQHEEASNSSESESGKAPSSTAKNFISATTLGERLGISNQATNQILAELGWIEKGPKGKGWIATAQGCVLGAMQKHHATGTSFVMWPEGIELNKSLISTVKDLNGETEAAASPQKEETKDAQGFREKFPATHRTTDGHWVRSRAEMLIDNWLYMSGIVHAYERRLPIDEDLYCDFYIPAGKVYIEYWGLENDPKYLARKKIKLDLYRKYNYNLIELSDEHLKNLDDVFPLLLRKFNIVVD